MRIIDKSITGLIQLCIGYVGAINAYELASSQEGSEADVAAAADLMKWHLLRILALQARDTPELEAKAAAVQAAVVFGTDEDERQAPEIALALSLCKDLLSARGKFGEPSSAEHARKSQLLPEIGCRLAGRSI
jgi:hypothetical protein